MTPGSRRDRGHDWPRSPDSPSDRFAHRLASGTGFLAAGAQRVVASHWSVDDAATAELMRIFFAKVTEAAREHRPIPYARALQEARVQLRRDARTATPFYWAPFVLIGPPAEAPRQAAP